jgi:hypothetical protein
VKGCPDCDERERKEKEYLKKEQDESWVFAQVIAGVVVGWMIFGALNPYIGVNPEHGFPIHADLAFQMTMSLVVGVMFWVVRPFGGYHD